MIGPGQTGPDPFWSKAKGTLAKEEQTPRTRQRRKENKLPLCLSPKWQHKCMSFQGTSITISQYNTSHPGLPTQDEVLYIDNCTLVVSPSSEQHFTTRETGSCNNDLQTDNRQQRQSTTAGQRTLGKGEGRCVHFLPPLDPAINLYPQVAMDLPHPTEALLPTSPMLQCNCIATQGTSSKNLRVMMSKLINTKSR